MFKKVLGDGIIHIHSCLLYFQFVIAIDRTELTYQQLRLLKYSKFCQGTRPRKRAFNHPLGQPLIVKRAKTCTDITYQTFRKDKIAIELI
jgi:hypothetical protein